MSLETDIAFALELFAEIEGLSVKRMFGGAGVYKEGVMFLLLADGAIWLRADPEFAMSLEAEGSGGRFEMEKDGRISHLPYWRLPDGVLEHPAAASALGRRAWITALRLKIAPPIKGAKKFPQVGGDSA